MVEGLRRSGVDSRTIARLQTSVEAIEAAPKERALLMLAATLTRSPQRSAPAVRAAVAAGWSSEEVAEAIFLVSFFNMVTRVAKAFALPPDELHFFDPGG